MSALQGYADGGGAARDAVGEFSNGDTSVFDTVEGVKYPRQNLVGEPLDELKALASADLDDDLGEPAVVDGVSERVRCAGFGHGRVDFEVDLEASAFAALLFVDAVFADEFQLFHKNLQGR